MHRGNGRLTLERSSTVIPGFDEITGGGLPRGHAPLVLGGAECSKTLPALRFVIEKAACHGGPGGWVTFEETPGEVQQDVFDLYGNVSTLARKKKISFECVEVGVRK